MSRILTVALVFALFSPPCLACIDYGDHLHWSATVPGSETATCATGWGERVLIARARSLLIAEPAANGEATILAELDCPSTISDIYAIGANAYLAVPGFGLQVVDLADPAAPQLLSMIPAPGSAQQLAGAGGHLYLGAGEAGLVVYSLADPAHPAPVDTLDTPGHARGLHICEGLLLLADDLWGLRIYGLTDPAAPALAAVADSPGALTDVACTGSLALASDRMLGLQIFDISDLEHPLALGHTSAGEGWSILGDSGVAILSERFAGLSYYDLSDPNAPALLGRLDADDEFHGLAQHQGLIYSCGEAGVRIAPQGPSSNVSVADSIVSGATELCAAGSRLYGLLTAAGPALLRIWDIDPTGDFAFRGSVFLTHRGTGDFDVKADTGWAYAACGAVHVVDVSDPANPAVHATLFTGGAAAIAIDGPCVAVAADSLARLWVGELTSPSTLVPRSIVPVGGTVRSVAVRERTGYLLCDGPPRILCFDLNDLTAPQLRGTLSLSAGPREMLIDGTYAYVSLDSGGLLALDCSDPFAPIVVGGLSTLTPLAKMARLGSTLAVVENSVCTWVVDISQPDQPRLAGRLEGGLVRGLAASSQYFFLGDYRMGLGSVYSFEAPCSALTMAPGGTPPRPLALGVYPNPANPNARLAFVVERAAHCEVTLYDCRGRALRHLWRGILPAGLRTLAWDGCDDRGRPLPSGEYLARLATGNASGTAKLVLVR